MGREFERRFLVRASRWRPAAAGTLFRQGYLSTAVGRTVRVRVIGDVGRITVKGARTAGRADKFDYPIPVRDAEFMLKHLCRRPLVEKTRYTVTHDRITWDVDVFHGVNEGLVIAEAAVRDGDARALPEWVGDEVTDEHRYASSRLAQAPFTSWPPPRRSLAAPRRPRGRSDRARSRG